MNAIVDYLGMFEVGSLNIFLTQYWRWSPGGGGHVRRCRCDERSSQERIAGERVFFTRGRINAHTIINHFHNLNKIKINRLLILYSRRSSLCREQNCSSLRKKFLFPTQILLERFHDIIIAIMIMFGSILSRISFTVYPFSLRCGPTSQTPFAIRLLLSITRFDILKS